MERNKKENGRSGPVKFFCVTALQGNIRFKTNETGGKNLPATVCAFPVGRPQICHQQRRGTSPATVLANADRAFESPPVVTLNI